VPSDASLALFHRFARAKAAEEKRRPVAVDLSGDCLVVDGTTGRLLRGLALAAEVTGTRLVTDRQPLAAAGAAVGGVEHQFVMALVVP
jgi:hypothetical protein